MMSPCSTPALAWSLRFDLHHHHASSTILDADKLEAEAEIAPRDVSQESSERVELLVATAAIFKRERERLLTVHRVPRKPRSQEFVSVKGQKRTIYEHIVAKRAGFEP